MTTRPVIIAVIGSGRPNAEAASLAERVGRELARRGGVLVCGGLGGAMEAAARGAKSAGGTTVGILPGDRPDDANEYIDIPIVTGMGHARNVINVRSAAAVIAVPGSHGTLSEIAHALSAGIPVVAVGAWSEIDEVTMAETPEAAVAVAFELAGA